MKTFIDDWSKDHALSYPASPSLDPPPITMKPFCILFVPLQFIAPPKLFRVPNPVTGYWWGTNMKFRGLCWELREVHNNQKLGRVCWVHTEMFILNSIVYSPWWVLSSWRGTSWLLLLFTNDSPSTSQKRPPCPPPSVRCTALCCSCQVLEWSYNCHHLFNMIQVGIRSLWCRWYGFTVMKLAGISLMSPDKCSQT